MASISNVSISEWYQLVEEAKIDETNGSHKWICSVGNQFQVLSDKEIL